MTDALTRQAISDAVTPLGWRLILGRLETSVAAPSTEAGLELARYIVAAAGSACQVDLRPDGVLLRIEPSTGWPDDEDIDLARAISAAVAAAGAQTEPRTDARAVQNVEFCIDAMDIDAVRPFWRAALAYVEAPDGALADPSGQGWTVWFQPMDEPRPQRNRIHFDIVVGHDEAAGRIAETVAAGGDLVSYAEAPAFWILADPEGNEVCICTWQGRDPAPDPDADT